MFGDEHNWLYCSLIDNVFLIETGHLFSKLRPRIRLVSVMEVFVLFYKKNAPPNVLF